jgi:tetratricopeptide (TPR) repeat protein
VVSPAEKAGDTIGPYKLLELIGEGGFGTVYVAEQQRPVRRKVALKIIKLGMDTKEVIGRFEAERNALTLMNHPNIARVYDAGVTKTGRPYFVMEFVQGVPISQFCDTELLSIEQRQGLFVEVCHAVQHAHQKGIIHRDLKPSNILVMLRDGQPVPKIIDFGVAKATSQELTERTVYTVQGQLVGTPEYMSPEQAEMTGIGVDSTTDIYSLGVILYELLTGVLPFDPTSLRSKGLGEIHRILREEDPPRPSTRLSTMDDTTTLIGRRRGTDTRTLRRELKGDLDWVVMKAMEKQRTRRYASASELAADVCRHLNHEPVLAGPPSPAYKLRKFVRRNRAGVAFAAVVTLVLIGGIVGTTWGMVEAARQRDDARDAKDLAVAAQQESEQERNRAVEAEQTAAQERDEAQRARDAEQTQRELAEHEATRARAMTDFMVDLLGLADPNVAQSPDVTMRQMLDQAALEVRTAFQNQPRSEAAVRTVIGNAYATLGELELAKNHYERALELLKTLEASQAEQLEVLWPYRLVLVDLGEMTLRGRTVPVGGKIRAVVAESNAELSEALTNLGAYTTKYHPELARRALDRLLQMASAELDPTDPLQLHVAKFLYHRGSELGSRDFEMAAELLTESLTIQRRMFPETHTLTARTINLLIEYRLGAGHVDEALALADESVDKLRKLLPRDHWYLAVAESIRAACLIEQQRYEEAEALLVESHDRIAAAQGELSEFAIRALGHRIELHDAWYGPEAAEPLRLRFASARGRARSNSSVADARIAFGPPLQELTEALERLQELIAVRGAAMQSESVGAAIDKAIETRRRLLADDDPRAMIVPDLFWKWCNLYANNGGPHEQCLKVAEEGSRIARANPDYDPGKRGANLWWFARLLIGHERYEEGEAVARESYTAHVEARGPDDWFAHCAESLISWSLMGQGRYAEAETYVHRAYDGLLETMGPTNANTTRAMKHVFELYVAWDKLDRLGEYMTRREAKRDIDWIIAERLFTKKYPALAVKLQRLYELSKTDKSIAEAYADVADTRKQSFDLAEPIAFVYADLLHSWGRAYRGRPYDFHRAELHPLFQEVLEIRRHHLPRVHPKISSSLFYAGLTCFDAGHFDDAVRLLEDRIALEQELAGGGTPSSLLNDERLYAVSLMGAGRYAEAESVLLRLYSTHWTRYGETVKSDRWDQIGLLLFTLIQLYHEWGKSDTLLEFEGRMVEHLRLHAEDPRATPDDKNTYLWMLLTSPRLDLRDYDLGLAMAEELVAQKPEDGLFVNTLAVAYYRHGRYEEALTTLQESSRLSTEATGEPDLADLAYLAMTHHRLGHPEEARAAMQDLRQRFEESRGMARFYDQIMLQEAEEVLADPP